MQQNLIDTDTNDGCWLNNDTGQVDDDDRPIGSSVLDVDEIYQGLKICRYSSDGKTR